MKFLSDTTQIAYSTLFQKTLDSRFSMLSNVSFVSKSVKGNVYWYCQYTDISGERKQRYIGPDSDETEKLINNIKSSFEESKSSLSDRKRLVAMISIGGGNLEQGYPAKIIEKLSDAGVFDSGGLLIGSYAFSCYGNMLGVIFDDSMRRTEDMDLAYDRSIEIGYIRDVRLDIQDAQSNMVEPKQINPWVPPYEMIAPDGFKIEFLTTRENPSDKSPVKIDRFNVNAQPLEFLDYLINNPVESVVLYGSGILVNVPNPAKYAIHKLAISQLRPIHKPEKSRKDLMQASALIEYFLSENPGALILAADEAKERGDMFYSFVEKGIKSMKDTNLALKFNEECWLIAKPVSKFKY